MPAQAEVSASIPNRWLIAVAGIATQMVLGTVYAWSVFKKPFMSAHDWSATEVGLAFTLVIAFIGLSAAFGGKFVDRVGARRVATLAAVLFSLGVLLAGVANHTGQLWLLWLGYGVIGGTGNGLAYITPIAVLVRWFPDRRGLITGLAVMGFGLGAAIMGQLGPLLVLHLGLTKSFIACAVVFLVILLTAAQRLVNPPSGWTPTGMTASAVAAANEASCDLRAALRTGRFYLLWLIFFVNVSAGIALISNLSPMAQALLLPKITPLFAGTVVSLCSLFNGLGRLFWSSLSDRLGRRATFLILLGTQIPLLLVLPSVSEHLAFIAIGCYILACYGGGFSTMPAFVADTFGPRCLGAIYGKILLAWSAAGVVGPLLMDLVQEQTHSYAAALQVAAGLLGVGVVLTLLYRKPARTL